MMFEATSAVMATVSEAAPPIVVFPKMKTSSPTYKFFDIPTPPVVVIDPVVLLEESVVSVTAILTGTAPNRLSTVSFLDVDALVSTTASISAAATSDAASEVNSENFTSAMV